MSGPTEISEPKRSHHLLWRYAILAVAALVVTLLLMSIGKLGTGDIEVYYQASQSLLEGRTDFYAPDFAVSRLMDFRYPPLFLYLFLPLGLLSFQQSLFLFMLISHFLLALAGWEFANAVSGSSHASVNRSVVIAIAFIVSAKYLLRALKGPNLNEIVIAAVVLAFCYSIRKADLRASFLLAFAISLKVFPVLFVPYFAIKRKWKMLAYSAVFLIALNLIPALHLGLAGTIDKNLEWASHISESDAFHELSGPVNVSLRGMIYRFTVEIDYSKSVNEIKYERVNFISIPKVIADGIWLVAASLLTLLTLGLIWHWNQARRNARRPSNGQTGSYRGIDKNDFFEFGLMISLVLIVSPRTNVIYLLLLVIPLYLLSRELVIGRSRFALSAYLTAAAVTVVFPLIPGKHTSRFFLVLGVDTFACFAVFFAMLWILSQRSSRLKDGGLVPTED